MRLCLILVCFFAGVLSCSGASPQELAGSPGERADKCMVDFLTVQEKVLGDYAWFGVIETMVLWESGDVAGTESIVLRAENSRLKRSRTDIVKTQSIPSSIGTPRYGQQLIVDNECRESHGFITSYRLPVNIKKDGFKVAQRMNEYDVYSILMLGDGDFVNNNVTSASAAMMYSNSRLHSAVDTPEGLEATWQFVHANVVAVVVLFDPKQGNMPTRVIWRSIADPNATELSKLLGFVHSTTLIEWTQFEDHFRPTSVKMAGTTLSRKAKYERSLDIKWLDKDTRNDIFESRSLGEIVQGRSRYLKRSE